MPGQSVRLSHNEWTQTRPVGHEPTVDPDENVTRLTASRRFVFLTADCFVSGLCRLIMTTLCIAGGRDSNASEASGLRHV